MSLNLKFLGFIPFDLKNGKKQVNPFRKVYFVQIYLVFVYVCI